jgi:antitoxin ParD1/3/4
VSTLQITLPEPLRAFLDEQVARGGHADASAYLADLLRQARLREAKRELEAKLLEGMRSPRRPMTDADWDRLRDRLLERSPELADE